MRNLTIMLCIVLCLTTCKKSSNSLPVTSSSLSGTWVRQSAIVKTYNNGVLSNTSTTSYVTSGNALSNPNLSIYFTANLNGTYLEPGINGISFTYRISGSQLTLNFGVATDLQTNYTIKSVTNTQLELVDGSSSGNGTVYDVTYLKN